MSNERETAIPKTDELCTYQDALTKMREERDAAIADATEQARIVGMGAERELKLIAERDALAAVADRLRNALNSNGYHAPASEDCDVCRVIAESKFSDDILAARDARITEPLQKQIDALAATVDKLMHEYCPEEMTPEQMAEWAKHQEPVVMRDDDLIEVKSSDYEAMLNDAKALRNERDALAATVAELRKVANDVSIIGGVKYGDDDLMKMLANAVFSSVRPTAVLAARDARVRSEALRDAANNFPGWWFVDDLRRMADAIEKGGE